MDAVLLGSVIGGFIGIVMGLIKIVEHLINKKKNGKNEKNCKDCVINSRIPAIYSIVSRVDNDGIPMCYTPRSSIETQKDIASVLNEVLSFQRSMLHVLEHIERSSNGERKRE